MYKIRQLSKTHKRLININQLQKKVTNASAHRGIENINYCL